MASGTITENVGGSGDTVASAINANGTLTNNNDAANTTPGYSNTLTVSGAVTDTTAGANFYYNGAAGSTTTFDNLTANQGQFHGHGGTLNLNGTMAFSGYFGSHSGGVVNLQSGSLTTNNGNVSLGENQAGGGTLTVSGGTFNAGSGSVYIGSINSPPPNYSGTLNVSGGTFSDTNAVGLSDGAVNISGTGSLDVSSLSVAQGGGTGTLTQTGGTFVYDTGYGGVLVGNGGTGVYNISAGTFSDTSGGGGYNGIYVGTNSTGSGSMTVSGTASVQLGYHGLYIDTANSSTGTATITGGVINTTGSLIFGGPFNNAVTSATGTFNLSGGTLSVIGVGTDSPSSTSAFNFNGGTLQATGNNGGFMGGLTTANVQNGGAIIDTNGKSITISQNLLSDPSLIGGTDGGLTLNSSGHTGTLILSGTGNTYNGNTTVDAGTLQIDTSFLARTSTVSIANGALMGLDYTGTDTIAGLNLGGTAQGSGIYGYGLLGSSFFSSGFTGTLTVAAIPEPATLGLMGVAGLGILLLPKRKRVG
jgi:autotransporter-associated beta strand protein